ncbi:LrgB family protein [Caryophanon latum]|uniref:CidB/LrgB family autolysis modulator n=1 Tax=Caryophanon latum TaxID=33977 RepID=A0A1C0Z2T2_9BACL|nr:LrgB family protein [Caryophanon latum]OCS93706.1 hypothetical protein A6K76_05060 [Caryophanon latum]
MIAVISFIGTIVIFLLMMKLHRKYPTPLLLPVLTTTTIIAIVLVLLNIPYDAYIEGGDWISKFLGPAIVGLAYPLYNQRALVFKYKLTILCGLVVAMIAGLISVFLLLKLGKATETYILTAIPKSITTPVAMEISSSLGGISALTVVLVMIAGFTGAFLGPLIFKLCRIDTAISRGLSIGAASHGVGISKLVDYGEEEVSVGSLSMGLSAVIGAFLCPLFVYIVTL